MPERTEPLSPARRPLQAPPSPPLEKAALPPGSSALTPRQKQVLFVALAALFGGALGIGAHYLFWPKDDLWKVALEGTGIGVAAGSIVLALRALRSPPDVFIHVSAKTADQAALDSVFGPTNEGKPSLLPLPAPGEIRTLDIPPPVDRTSSSKLGVEFPETTGVFGVLDRTFCLSEPFQQVVSGKERLCYLALGLNEKGAWTAPSLWYFDQESAIWRLAVSLDRDGPPLAIPVQRRLPSPTPLPDKQLKPDEALAVIRNTVLALPEQDVFELVFGLILA